MAAKAQASRSRDIWNQIPYPHRRLDLVYNRIIHPHAHWTVQGSPITRCICLTWNPKRCVNFGRFNCFQRVYGSVLQSQKCKFLRCYRFLIQQIWPRFCIISWSRTAIISLLENWYRCRSFSGISVMVWWSSFDCGVWFYRYLLYLHI